MRSSASFSWVLLALTRPGMALTVPRLQSNSLDEQARVQIPVPTALETHTTVSSVVDLSSLACPPSLTPDVFPWEKVEFAAATSYCSRLIATATTTSSFTSTLTAWVMNGTTMSPVPPQPTHDSYNRVALAVEGYEPISVTSACDCLVGSPTAPFTVTKTAIAVETHTAI